MRTGRLVSGTRLPSARSLATHPDIARNTVADAYAELAAEGTHRTAVTREPDDQAGRAARPGTSASTPTPSRS
ncbi:GntR family transcriptional regulator [Streptomyces sp. GESEQ-35]|uniref:GntR family transcriptional regulator n=1 Tax=Streptomyces sp. GESEQ-35 TaxID=2812657 RepID=UPI0035ABAD7D